MIGVTLVTGSSPVAVFIHRNYHSPLLHVVLPCLLFSSDLACSVRVNDRRVVFWSPAVACDEPRYNKWLVLVLIYFVGDVCGLPLVIFFLLHVKFRRLLQERSGTDYSALRSRFGVLFLPFAKHAYLWQIAILLRRLACVFIDSFLESSLRNCFVHFIFLLLHLRVRPSAARSVDRLETSSLALLVVLSLMLTAFPSDYPFPIRVVICLLVVLPIVGFVIFAVHTAWTRSRSSPRPASTSCPSMDSTTEPCDIELADAERAGAGNYSAGNSNGPSRMMLHIA